MSQLTLPPSHKVKIWILGRIWDDTPNAIYLSASTYQPTSSSDYFLIKEVEIEVDLSDVRFDPLTKQVEVLRAQMTAIRGEAEATCTKLQSQINRLLQLEYVEAGQ